MADFPLLKVPAPAPDERPAGRGGGDNLRLPTPTRQVERLAPVFQRLRDAFGKARDPVTLREDPAALAPERALVLEVAGGIADFYRAVQRIPGLEYLGEGETEFEPDEDFAEKDTRTGREDQDRTDRPVAGRLYLAMPDTNALRQLLRLWDRYEAGEQPDRGFAEWFNLFGRLRQLRAWGPEDRIPEATIEWLADRTEAPGDVRVEIELWRSGDQTRHAQSVVRFERAVREVGGEIRCRASIPEIAYEAALVTLPSAEVRQLVDRRFSPLGNCDEIMFVRPQTLVQFPTGVEPLAPGPVPDPLPSVGQPPIAAVLDGVPILGHRLLDGRVDLDDPDDLSAISVVSKRSHGTGMASLILHGDRSRREVALPRLLHVRPVLCAPKEGAYERPQPDRLLIDTIYRAIVRMKAGDDSGRATAPEVFLVNLSLGDPLRPYAGSISPWARLLDHLADQFGILFLVSAGNIPHPVPLHESWQAGDLRDAATADRERVILKALGSQRSQRTLLSPAEALNVVTVGAWNEDGANQVSPSPDVFPPYDAGGGPNITSAMGLGHRKTVKPDIFMPGGREHVQVFRAGSGYRLDWSKSSRLFGLKAAVPDPRGQLDAEGLTSGTSAATALATRAAHRLFDALVDEDNGAILDGVESRYYGVIVKALLAHRAHWGEKGVLLEGLYGPTGQGKHTARKDNIARVLGYGRPHVEEAMTCAANRATLIGYGSIASDGRAQTYRLPLPSSLERVTEPRRITLTLAWFSPVNMRHHLYRRAKLEMQPIEFPTHAGVRRASDQPSNPAVGRGSLFHVHYEGDSAIQFVDDGHIRFRVFCREQAGALDQEIPYGLAVTIEAGEGVPVYEEIRQRLGIQPRVTGAVP